MRRLLVSLAVLCSLVAAATAGAEHSTLRVIQAPGGNPGPAFGEFYREYHAMLMGWWQHGGESTAQGKWWVVAASVRHPGQSRPHFVITLTRETKGQSVAVLTFSVPPRAQGQVLLAAHAAYDATVGALLGEPRYQGTLEWRGAFEDTVLIVPSFRFAGAIPDRIAPFSLRQRFWYDAPERG